MLQRAVPADRFRRLLLVGGVFGLALLTAGWAFQDRAGQPDSGVRTFVGRVKSSEALIGIVANGDQLRAYVCDSATTAEWFRGKAEAGGPELASAGGLRLAARIEPDAARGVVTFQAGTTLEFEAIPATGQAGLYRFEETLQAISYVSGWIVLADGTQAGATTSGGQIVATSPLRINQNLLDPE
jgi:hypothetical protein